MSGSVKPTMVQLGVDAKDIIAGNEKTNFITALAGSGGVQSYEWIVKGKPGSTVTLTVVSQKSGKDTRDADPQVGAWTSGRTYR